MVTAEELEELLLDDELDALELIVKPKTIQNIRMGTLSDQEKLAVKLVDRLINESPALAQPLTIYRSFENGSLLQGSPTVTDKSFLTGSSLLTAEGKDVVTLAITVPAGTKVFELPGGSYIARRGVALDLEGEGPVLYARFKGSGKFATVIGMPPTTPEELAWKEEYLSQFHLTGQHDQSSHSRGGGGGKSKAPGMSKAAMSPEREKLLQEREARLREREKRLQQKQKVERKAERRRNRQQFMDGLLNVAGFVAAVATIGGLLIATGVIQPDTVSKGVANVKSGVAKGKENIQRKNNARNLTKLFDA